MFTPVNYPKPFHLDNIKAIVVVAPGTVTDRVWRGYESSNAWYARLGYQTENPAKLLQWEVYELGDCCLCGIASATVYWRGPRTEKTAIIPQSVHTRKDKTVIGPREGPSECRVLLCRTCYMNYGARLAIATYPPMDKTSCVKCECKWDGEVLHKCPDHLDVVVQCGHHVNRGEGSLLAAPEQVTPLTIKRENSHDSLEDLNPSPKTELDALIEASFPIPDASRPNIKLYSRAPEKVRLADTPSRANVITEESCKGKVIDMSVQDVVKAMMRARSCISQRAKAQPFTSGYSSKRFYDWYTNCTPCKNLAKEGEVLTWEVLAAPIPMLPKSTGEGNTSGSTKDNLGMISVFSWVKIQIHLDLNINGAVKAMAVSFSHVNNTADQLTNRFETEQGYSLSPEISTADLPSGDVRAEKQTESPVVSKAQKRKSNAVTQTAQTPTSNLGESSESDGPPTKVAHTAEVWAKPRGSTGTGSASGPQMKGDVEKKESTERPTAHVQTSDRGKSLERDEPPAKVARTAEAPAKPKESTCARSASGTQTTGDVVNQERANKHTDQKQTSDRGKSLEGDEPPAKVARTSEAPAKPKGSTGAGSASGTQTTGDVVNQERANKHTDQKQTSDRGKSLERDEPPAKAWTKPGWSGSFKKEATVQLYDEDGRRFQHEELFNPKVWQSIAIVRHGRIPRHDPFMAWDGHYLTRIMAESTLLAVSSIKVRPGLLRRRSPVEGAREEAQVALYQNNDFTWAVISALGTSERTKHPWSPPLIAAILSVPSHPRQWQLFKGVKERADHPCYIRSSAGDFPREGEKGQEPWHGNFRNNYRIQPWHTGHLQRHTP
ncbi:uncharacterized protein LOC134468468 [Engraulis encrasicolus]|uniref:uncharacterized protein LOC134468468 n=1 Tax=Engraulis encrasicolus TaxID=184585 RepID=UPI002FD1D331